MCTGKGFLALVGAKRDGNCHFGLIFTSLGWGSSGFLCNKKGLVATK